MFRLPPHRLHHAMRVHLEYGRTGLDVELPDRHVVKLPPLSAGRSAGRSGRGRAAGLWRGPRPAAASGASPRGRRNACVAICDMTRPVPNRLLLAPLLATLEEAGIPREILILVATGLHRPSSREELVEMVGPEILRDYRIENHDGRQGDTHTYLGDTPRGVPVWIDSRYVSADLKITTGLIEPHFMAGFSGGRKSDLPRPGGPGDGPRVARPRLLEHPCPGRRPGGQPGARGEHADRPPGGLRFHRQRRDRRSPPDTLGRGRRHGSGVHGRRRLCPAAGDRHGAGGGRRGGDQQCRLSVGCHVLPDGQGHGGRAADRQVRRHDILAAGMSEGIGSEFRSLYDDNPSPEAFMQRILGKGYFVMDQWQVEELAKGETAG